jgi:hypothetical protein
VEQRAAPAGRAEAERLPVCLVLPAFPLVLPAFPAEPIPVRLAAPTLVRPVGLIRVEPIPVRIINRARHPILCSQVPEGRQRRFPRRLPTPNATESHSSHGRYIPKRAVSAF